MRRSFSSGLSKPLCLLAFAGLLGACSSLSEEQRFAVSRDWEKVASLDIFPSSEESHDFWALALPLPSATEELAERRICLHKNGENRVILQDGVSDRVDYRRCALAPYPETDAPGQRLENRPDDVVPSPTGKAKPVVVPLFNREG